MDTHIKLGRIGSDAAGCMAQPRRCSTQVQSVTGTKKQAYICRYANQRHCFTYYAENSTVSKGGERHITTVVCIAMLFSSSGHKARWSKVDRVLVAWVHSRGSRHSGHIHSSVVLSIVHDWSLIIVTHRGWHQGTEDFHQEKDVETDQRLTAMRYMPHFLPLRHPAGRPNLPQCECLSHGKFVP